MKNSIGTLVLSLALATFSTAQAQVTGDLEVRVSDPSGSAVAGASVTVAHEATGIERRASTTETGAARLALLAGGRYRVRVYAAGFQEATAAAEVNTGAVREVRVTLALETTRQEVTVSSEAVSISTASAQLQTTAGSRQLSELPLAGAGPLVLAGTTPGVIPVSPRNPFLNLGSYSSNGGRGRANNITVDSATTGDITTSGSAGLGTVPDYLIREVTVIAHNFSAEFGRNASSQFQIITRSGSNERRGELWEVFRNDKLNSRDYFDRSGQTPPLKDNRWGALLGGPIVKDRLVVLGHYEQQMIRGAGGTRVATTWRPDQVAAIVDPASSSLFERLQGPRYTSASGTVSTASPLRTNAIAGSLRGDWNLTSRDTLFARWAIQDLEARNPGITFVGSNLPTSGAVNYSRPQNATLSYTRAWSARLVSNSLVAFGRTTFAYPPLEDLGGPFIAFLDGTAPLGIFPGFPQGRAQSSYQYLNTVTWVKQRHTLKLGHEVVRIQANSTLDQNVRGTWTFPSFAAFGAGRPAQYSQRFGNSVRGHRAWQQSWFVQDDVRLARYVTLNLGLRLEAVGGVSEVNNLISNLNLDRRLPLGGAGDGPLGSVDVGGRLSRNNVNPAPRVGFAWNPRGGKTALRGGYGIAYDFLYLNPVVNTRLGPPFMFQFSTAAFTGNDGYDRIAAGTSDFQRLGSGTVGTFGTSVRNFGTFSPVDQALANPETHQWNLTLEWDIRGLLVRTGYVGSKTNFLQRSRPVNLLRTDLRVNARTPAEEQELIGSGRLTTLNGGLNAGPAVPSNRLDPRFNAVTLVDSSANSNYHSGQLWVHKRLARRAAFTVAYTLGKSMDDASDALGVLVSDTHLAQNPFDWRDNRGPSAFDVRHRLAVTHLIELPWFRKSPQALARWTLGGWSWNGIWQLQSGAPVNLFSGSRTVAPQFADPLFLGGAPGTSLRPNLSGPLNLAFSADPGAGRNNPNKTTASGLTQPLIGNFGTLGRNVLRQNGLTQYDVSAQKEFTLSERLRAQLQAQAFNVFNNTSFGRPGQLLSAAANFGYYQDTDTNPRSMALILRVVF